MNLSVQHAVVVGGGIGGLSAAAALRRAGVSVTVLEGRRELSAAQAGGGMHLWHNGTRALADLGLGRAVDALVADGARLSTAEFCSSTGALLARWPVHRIEDAVGAPTVGIDRGRLHDLLLHAAAGADIRRGAVCTGFRQDDQRVSARLADGESVTGDVLVGADGLRSVVRRQLLGDRAPRPAGYASWQAIVDFEDDACPVGLFRVLWGPGARFLFYRLSAGTLYWEGQFAAAPGGQDASTGRKVAVLRRFAGYADPVRAILEATPERAITRLDVYDREPVRTWGHGRVTLLGDAAHPMTNAIGQGANQALEDAVVLAAVAREATDWPTALRAYERRRIPRTTSMVRTAHNLQRLNRLDSPAACLVRNQLLRGGLRLGFRKHAKDMALAY